MASKATPLTDVNAIIALALQGLDAVLSLIAEIKGQSGMTDDEIMAQAQAQTGVNSQTYQTLLAALKNPSSSAT